MIILLCKMLYPLPSSSPSPIQIDPTVPLDKAALLGCGVTTGYGAPIKVGFEE